MFSIAVILKNSRNKNIILKKYSKKFISGIINIQWGTAVVQWLRCCARNRKVVDSISGCVSGFFMDIKFFRSHLGPEVDSACNRNEYQEYFLGVKAAGA